MSTLSGNITPEQCYTDLEYGVDVVVKHMTESIVLLKEIETGNQRLCRREEFTRNEDRFLPKNE